MRPIKSTFLLLATLFYSFAASARQAELDSGWFARSAADGISRGEELSSIRTPLTGWKPAVVPGTILATQLLNSEIPDPFYGMNNSRIPDANSAYERYVYWFVNQFKGVKPGRDEKIWLMFRGVNNSFDVYMNGKRLNGERKKSMFLRQCFDITPYMVDGDNRIAVQVFPPDPPGVPNGGQGGDGTIAKNITAQYTAGWDWIQPVPDRNTGIWDKVFIKKTKQVVLTDTRVVTLVPGKRVAEGKQQAAVLQVTADAENADDAAVSGTLKCTIGKYIVSVQVQLNPREKQTIHLPDITVNNPELWWPNGYGKQNLYQAKTAFLLKGKKVSDEEQVTFGIRQITTAWNTYTQSREILVNGQRIFIKGGNRILSDELLRFSKERYDAEVRYHRDMNLNMIRVWGGGISERPEFYDACDKYGLMVMQDFWVSGDCNGRWYDSLKHDDTTTRRNYPADHKLFIETVTDQVKMLRNHPSLALWCGGNEIAPPADILKAIKDTLLPQLDNTRYFFDFSNADSMSYKGGDGPYTIQPVKYFWEHRSFPFNSEIGSIGVGNYSSLQRFIPAENMKVPVYDAATKKWQVDPVWKYHKYSSYDSSIEAYGHPADVKDFCKKAQLVNYDQYRALMEGATSHMWDWYTGIMIWKTQNPWTAMVGQMYDVYLEPNACLYGLAEGGMPVHIAYDPVNNNVLLINNGPAKTHKLHMRVSLFATDGQPDDLMNSFVEAEPGVCKIVGGLNNTIEELRKDDGLLLDLRLFDAETGEAVDENTYWLPNASGNYPILDSMPPATINATAVMKGDGIAELTLDNPQLNGVGFFIHLTLNDSVTGKAILPAFFNNNYISVLPGTKRVIHVAWTPQQGVQPVINMEGWNVAEQQVRIKTGQ